MIQRLRSDLTASRRDLEASKRVAERQIAAAQAHAQEAVGAAGAAGGAEEEETAAAAEAAARARRIQQLEREVAAARISADAAEATAAAAVAAATVAAAAAAEGARAGVPPRRRPPSVWGEALAASAVVLFVPCLVYGLSLLLLASAGATRRRLVSWWRNGIPRAAPLPSAAQPHSGAGGSMAGVASLAAHGSTLLVLLPRLLGGLALVLALAALALGSDPLGPSAARPDLSGSAAANVMTHMDDGVVVVKAPGVVAAGAGPGGGGGDDGALGTGAAAALRANGALLALAYGALLLAAFALGPRCCCLRGALGGGGASLQYSFDSAGSGGGGSSGYHGRSPRGSPYGSFDARGGSGGGGFGLCAGPSARWRQLRALQLVLLFTSAAVVALEGVVSGADERGSAVGLDGALAACR